MGIVWLARDDELERDVALKFLAGQIIHDQAVLADLKRETKRSLELTHPNIVRIHDFVQDGRAACISMEYVNGETLSTLRANRMNSVFEAPDLEDVVTQWCEAMHYAHHVARIVHCDLKPANLMLNVKGVLKITDFGIARSLSDSASKLTVSGGKSGTLVYMSPQQLNGDPPSVLDDIYSMGATLFELLSGKPPFFRGQIDRQVFDKIPPSIADRRLELGVESRFIVPLRWEDTVASCLAKRAEERPQSVGEVLNRLNLHSSRLVEKPPLPTRQQSKPLAPATFPIPLHKEDSLLADVLGAGTSGFANRKVPVRSPSPTDGKTATSPSHILVDSADRSRRNSSIRAVIARAASVLRYLQNHRATLPILIGVFLTLAGLYFVLSWPRANRASSVALEPTPRITPKASPAEAPSLTVQRPPAATVPSLLSPTASPASRLSNRAAPSKAELEAMYNKAFSEFGATNYDQALKELDAIDARQPNLVESQNLRGVILMRQAQFDQAEAALRKALATDPKFWNARFNFAEIPFLRKDWAEARTRFKGLLEASNTELQGDTAQLIEYKIFLTYLMEGQNNMAESILATFELTPNTAAAAYSKAAIAFQHQSEKEANDLIAAAEKKFSRALNRLFVESFYELGWMRKPTDQTRVALEITTAADRAAKEKVLATEKFQAAEEAFQQRDYTAARKLIDEADAADPNQPSTINFRGEILLAQRDFDGAENAFNHAAKIDPKFREALYNLAQIPFKKKDYATAHDRFEALLNNMPAPAGDKDQAAQIIKYKVFLTLLLGGKDGLAQKMMEQFQFTGDTPALYYAQAAWEFNHNDAAKANDWIVSAKKIYSPALNLVFADSLYDVGWLQAPSNITSVNSAALKQASDAEATPTVSPSPMASLQDSETSAEEIKKLEEKWATAIITHDTITIGALLADDYAATTPSGAGVDREGALRRIKRDTDRYEVVTVDVMDFHRDGESADITGLLHERGKTKTNQPFDRTFLFTDIWVRRNGKWVCSRSNVRSPK
jgi:serine/threonine protein kinase/Flp pilus assembly protein TadD/ketosteroid isomerase-like protein